MHIKYFLHTLFVLIVGFNALVVFGEEIADEVTEEVVVFDKEVSVDEITSAFVDKTATKRGFHLLCKLGKVVSIQIPFEYDSAQLSSEGQFTLDKFAEAMRGKLKACKFDVEGHTDAKGKLSYNMSLSQRRAKTVVKYLDSKGVEVSRLQAVGMGPKYLLNADNPYAEQNRRVQFRTR